jgi:hypothetical protein
MKGKNVFLIILYSDFEILDPKIELLGACVLSRLQLWLGNMEQPVCGKQQEGEQTSKSSSLDYN